MNCTSTTRAGRPCKAHPVKGSEPPRCAAHGGGSRPVGAPKGNQNAVTHGAYSADDEPLTLDDAIASLSRRIRDLESYIDNSKLTTEQYGTLTGLYSSLLGRLGRLMRDLRALSGDAADGFAGAIAIAMDELSTELGIDI